jgi:hypothetical protein
MLSYISEFETVQVFLVLANGAVVFAAVVFYFLQKWDRQQEEFKKVEHQRWKEVQAITAEDRARIKSAVGDET